MLYLTSKVLQRKSTQISREIYFLQRGWSRHDTRALYQLYANQREI